MCGFSVNAALHFIRKGVALLSNAFSAFLEGSSVGVGGGGWCWGRICVLLGDWGTEDLMGERLASGRQLSGCSLWGRREPRGRKRR